MKFDSTFTFALIISMTSLLSPIIVSIINNRHLRKMKALDIQQENFKLINLHKRDIFENFLKLVGEFSYEYTSVELSELTSAYYLVLPYIPMEKTAYFQQFSAIIGTMDFTAENSELSRLLHDEIIPTIKHEVEKLHPVNSKKCKGCK